MIRLAITFAALLALAGCAHRSIGPYLPDYPGGAGGFYCSGCSDSDGVLSLP
jgi:hypothetical protein